MNPRASGPRARIGIFGGTFNPIHVGHLRAAEEVLELLDLDRIVFVPSASPPHKCPERDVIAPARERCRFVELAIASNERFALDTLELDREGHSYSVDTLRVFGQRLAPEKPVFVIGAEAFDELGTWREPTTLLELAHFAVVSRPGPHGEKSLPDRMPPELAREVEFERDGRSARHRKADTWIRLLAVTALDVSSTDIRRRLREGRSIRYLVPEKARLAVEESGVYAKKEAQ